MNVRERYNAKGRQSTAGPSRKHSKGKRNLKGRVLEDALSPSLSLPRTTVDPNAPILIPKTQEEKEWERKERMRLEVCSILCFALSFGKTDTYICKALTSRTNVFILFFSLQPSLIRR